MNPPPLSNEAQCKIDELEQATYDGGIWPNDAYLDKLRGLAAREISSLEAVQVTGQGLEEWERSREEHRVAGELKAYAIYTLNSYTSAELAKFPELAPLDEFLKLAMPNTGKKVSRDRFIQFLTAKAEGEVDLQMKLFPKPKISRAERVQQTAEAAIRDYDEHGMSATTQHEYRDIFRKWWKTQEEGNPLGKCTKEAVMKATERQVALIKVLPSRPSVHGISKEKWKEKADKAGLVPSERTFRRDVQQLVAKGRVRVQEDGNFRQLSK